VRTQLLLIWRALARYGILAGTWTVAATAGSKIQTLAALSIAGYTGGLVESGRFGLATGAALLSATLADFGLSSYITRSVSSGETRERSQVRRPAAIRIALTGPLALISSLILLQPHDGSGWLLVLATAAYAATYEASTLALRLAYGAHQFRSGASINGSVRAATLVPMLVIGAFQGPLSALLLIMSLGELTIAAWQYLASPLTGETSHATATLSFRSSWRLGVASIANVVANRSDVIIVSVTASAVVLGEYNIGSQVENALTVAALIPAGATVAYVARRESTMGIRRMNLAVSVAVASIYTVLALPFLLFPQFLVPWIFGVELADYSVVRLCVVAGYFSALAAVQLQVLVGQNRQARVMTTWIFLIPVAITSLTLGAVAGGSTGAGWGALIRDAIFLALALGPFTRRR